MPASWFNSVNSFFSIIAVPPLVALWRWQAKSGREPGDIAKIGIGSALMGVSALFMTLGALLPGPGRAHRGLLAARLLRRHGDRLPLLLAGDAGSGLAKRARQVNATLMGGSFLSLFVGSVVMGWVGSFYAEMDPAAFWALDASFGLAGGLIVLAINRPLSRALAPAET